MKTGVIYKIENPTGKLYIGKAVSFASRMWAYKNLKCEQQKALYASLVKYGFDAHKIEIIFEGPVDILAEKEIAYIKKYNSFSRVNPNGLNLTLGGEGLLGVKQSQETIEKRRQAHTGTKRSLETKKLMSELKKGKAPACTKNPKTEYFLKVARESKLGRKRSDEEIQSMKQTKLNNFIEKHGSVIQIDVKTKQVLKEWNMLPKDIAKELNIDGVSIYRSLKYKITIS